nr:ISAs1 family transposase [Limnoglobus roseus]
MGWHRHVTLNQSCANDWRAIRDAVARFGTDVRAAIEACIGSADLAEELVTKAGWPDVAAVVQVNRERSAGDRGTSTTHYDITSRRGTAAEMAGLIRGHWGIESMHWILDVVYGEDDNRTRAGHAGANLAMIRKVAVSLTRRAPGKQSGVTKRLKAGWDDEYLLQVLQGIPAIVVR